MFNTKIDESSIKSRNYALQRGFLQKEQYARPMGIDKCEELTFLRIKGLSNFWLSQNMEDFDAIMADVINGLTKYDSIFCFIIEGNEQEISVNIGTSKQMCTLLKTSLYASYPFIDMEEKSSHILLRNISEIANYGGIVTGNPTRKSSGENPVPQIERLCKGMFGHKWAYVTLAKGLSPIQTNLSRERLLNELNEVNKVIKQTVLGGTLGNQTIVTENFLYQDYFDSVKVLEGKLENGISRGMWRSCTYYMTDDELANNKLKNLLTSIYAGDESRPEKIRCIDVIGIKDIVSQIGMISDLSPEVQYHPAGIWKEHDQFQVDCFKYKYQNILNSEDLAVFCQIPRQEMPGYFINQYVEFDVAERRDNNDFIIGNIINGSQMIDNKFGIELDDLTRHGVIIGITGGGKTNTSKSLLSTLWTKHKKPFLVIESAKREYWEITNLGGFENTFLFTLGAEGENSIPYRINPFEVVGNVALQTHIDFLLSTFKASFELFPPMPYILERSVYEVYADKGWDVLKDINTLGKHDFPTLEDLYYKVEVVADSLGYDGEVQSNVKAALQARINSLRVGGKGAMLDTHTSFPMEKLLGRPAVLELEDIGDDDVKAFVIGIVMIQLYEYRRSHVEHVKGLQHLLLIEEAHRLLKNVTQGGGESANPRAKAVEFFTNLLAEIRSYGQGILIADQIPTKLAPDTLKNTNLKIVHRTVMEDDRKTIGRSMNMTDEQIDYLSALKRGIAAVYAEGDNRPKLVKMPLMKNIYDKSRKEVLSTIRENIEKVYGPYYQGSYCKYCGGPCKFPNFVTDLLGEGIIKDDHLSLWLEVMEKNNFSAEKIEELMKHIKTKIIQAELNDCQKVQILNGLLDKSGLKDAYKNEKLVAYLKLNASS